MSASGVLWSLAVSGLAAVGAWAPPSELVLDTVPGFELTSGDATDLGYADYLELEPDSLAHLDPESEEAVGMLGAIEVWTDAAAQEQIVIEVVRAVDEPSAKSFVDQAAANAIAVGLGATDPPFAGAWSYSGGTDEWTNKVSWSQGPYAITLTHVSPGETDRTRLDAAALQQAEAILDATGAEVSEDAAVDDDAPPAPTEAPEPTPLSPSVDEDGGVPTAVVVAIVLAGAAVLLLLVLWRRRRDRTPAVTEP
jgi:MYXO-CTERM domain-containing protein